ncbi:MAG TPA: TRAP transporter TatT component family protein [Pyrinomonadaceae bacterium]|nr:TRAP transporter TatT component family protein [Pyrinomonadaceae bacterium]
MNLPLEETTRRADELYRMREDLENVRESVRALEESVHANSYDLLWRKGRALFFLGQEAETVDEARAHHARAARACEQAVGDQPLRVEGHFWLGVNLALLARNENPLKALRLALRARRSLERAVRLDPAYHGAGPLRVLARLQQNLPRLLGGGGARALSNYERAIELAPTNTVTRLYLAELLLETGDEARARTVLLALLKAPPDPLWAFESERDRKAARRMLDGLQS